MFPCHTDHYNVGHDKSDNNLPAMLCYSGRSGLWKNRISPFVLVGASCFQCMCMCKMFNLFHLSHQHYVFFFLVSAVLVIVMGCVKCATYSTTHFFRPCLVCWYVGQRVIGVKHGVTAGALNVYTVISPNSLMKTMKP